jgi:signal transduction histidine kinase/DNA-binding response OmpR family regulator
MSSSSDDLHRQLKELQAQNIMLKTKAANLAQANVYAAELLAQLEEANEREQRLVRRGEELDLQNRIDVALLETRDESEIIEFAVERLKESSSLGVLSIECSIPKSSDTVPDQPPMTSASPPDRVENNRLSVPIPIEPGIQGSMTFSFRATDKVWCDRWIRFLWSLGIQLGSAIQKRRIEHQIQQMNYQLTLARDQAIEASQAKTSFLANMSHELRTPLNAILGYSEMLIEESSSQTPQSVIEDASKIQLAGKHLLSLIEDILDAAKIESGKATIHIATIDVKELVLQVANTIESLATKSNNTVECYFSEDIGMMESDPLKLRQCLLNLLSNACKFSSNSRIDIRVSAVTDQATTWIRFAVTDRGIGITEVQIGRLFKPFVQADDSMTKRFGGTGLGLAITKSHCQLLGGDISVESSPGVKTTFTITLPRVTTATPRASQIPDLAAHASSVNDPPIPSSTHPLPDRKLDKDVPNTKVSNIKILVIDDDADSLELTQRFLSKDGYSVIQATSFESGLLLVKSQRPDLILMDVIMPNINGWQALAMFKADPAIASIPVILLTVDENKYIGKALGASECLPKPIDWPTLKKTLLTHIQESQTRYVLVVEDDQASADIISRTLQRNGWPVEVVNNGKEALKKVQATVPSLVVLDLMMPEMDGFTCLHLLRSYPHTRTLPVIILSNKHLTEEDRMRLEGPAVKILPKTGTQRTELVEWVRKILG